MNPEIDTANQEYDTAYTSYKRALDEEDMHDVPENRSEKYRTSFMNLVFAFNVLYMTVADDLEVNGTNSEIINYARAMLPIRNEMERCYNVYKAVWARALPPSQRPAVVVDVQPPIVVDLTAKEPLQLEVDAMGRVVYIVD